MPKWLLAIPYFFLIADALTNHAAPPGHRRLNPRTPLPENADIFGQQRSSTITRTARLRANLPVFELIYGQNTEYELGRALEKSVLFRGRPLSTMIYTVEPDLAMFNWMIYDNARRVLSGVPPIAQPLPVPLNAPSYIDVYVYIGTDRLYRLRTILGIMIRDRNDTITVAGAPTSSPVPMNEQVPRPRGVVLGMVIAACVLLFLLILGGLGWMIAMRGYFKRTRDPVAQTQNSPRTNTQHSNSHSLPSSSNRSSSITSTRRRVRTADHGTPSPSRPELQLSSGRTKDSTPPSARKRAATLLQTIHTRAIRGSPRIGFSTSSSKASPNLDASSTTARKAISPRLGLGQFSPRLGFGQFSPKLDVQDFARSSLTVAFEESPGLMNSWSSALRLDPFNSPGSKNKSVDSLGRKPSSLDPVAAHERPASPTPHKSLGVGGNKTMSVSELFRSGATANDTMDDSGASSARDDHAGNIGFMDSSSSVQASSSTQVTPQVQATLNRAESYAERTNQLGMALLSPPTSMHTKPASEALGISFDSFFSPATERPVPEPRYGEVSSERVVRVGHSQETLTTAYVTASESGVSPPGGQPERDSSSIGHGIPECIETIGSPSTLHSQTAELDGIASPSLTAGDLEVTARAESSHQTLSIGSSNQSLSVEYGRADRSLRGLDSFPAMLRGSLSCFPEDVSLNTPILPSTGTSRSELTHRETYDIMLLPADDLTQGCLVLTRIGDDSGEQDESTANSDNTGGVSFMVTHEASSLVARSEEDSILSPDLSEHATEQTDSIISREGDSNMRSSVDSIMSGRRVDRSSNGLKYAAQLFLSSNN